MCDECEKCFHQKSKLNHHILVSHEGIRIPCDQCEKSFTQSRHLKDHVNEVHKGMKNHICQQCLKSFGIKGKLQWHTKTVQCTRKEEDRM